MKSSDANKREILNMYFYNLIYDLDHLVKEYFMH